MTKEEKNEKIKDMFICELNRVPKDFHDYLFNERVNIGEMHSYFKIRVINKMVYFDSYNSVGDGYSLKFSESYQVISKLKNKITQGISLGQNIVSKNWYMFDCVDSQRYGITMDINFHFMNETRLVNITNLRSLNITYKIDKIYLFNKEVSVEDFKGYVYKLECETHKLLDMILLKDLCKIIVDYIKEILLFL